MPFSPRTTDEIYVDVQLNLTNSIAQISSFNNGGFNDQMIQAYAEVIREAEIKALAAELAGYPDYAGKELTENDLDLLGIDNLDPEEINPYMADQQLDELAKMVGESRYQGTQATGEVTFQTSSDSVEIDEGFTVSTRPDSAGNTLRFYVDADGDGVIDQNSTATVSPADGTREVTVDVIADGTGTEYNVGADALTYMPVPEPGVESATNPSETTGGEDIQSNEDLRVDVKDAVFRNSGGGTEDGLKGRIKEDTDADVSVGIDEFLKKSPTFVDVIVDGGSDSLVRELIDDARPIGIEHNLVRPEVLNVAVKSSTIGTEISETSVRNGISDYITALDVSDPIYRSRIMNGILDSDSNIVSAPALTTLLTEVLGELHTYTSGQDVYELSFVPLGLVENEQHVYQPDTDTYSLNYTAPDATSMTVTAVVNNRRVDLTRGSTEDYTIVDDDSDGTDDAITLTGNTVPDEYSVLEVDYTHGEAGVDTVEHWDGTTYTEGTDFAVVDNDGDGIADSIDFSIGGASPAGGERFSVDYSPQQTFQGNIRISDRKKFSYDSGQTTVTTVTEN